MIQSTTKRGDWEQGSEDTGIIERSETSESSGVMAGSTLSDEHLPQRPVASDQLGSALLPSESYAASGEMRAEPGPPIDPATGVPLGTKVDSVIVRHGGRVDHSVIVRRGGRVDDKVAWARSLLERLAKKHPRARLLHAAIVRRDEVLLDGLIQELDE